MRRLVALTLACTIPVVLSAQAPTRAVTRESTPTVSSEQALADLHAALRSLVEAQESYFVGHITYTSDLAALGAQGKLGRPNVVLLVTHAGGRSWRAIAQHAAYKGKSCVLFIGDPSDFPMPSTKAEGRRPGPSEEAVPVCDALR